MSTPRKYRKKPVTIETMRLEGTTGEIHAVYRWIEENTAGSYDTNARDENGDRLPGPDSGVSIDASTGFLVIATLEGEMTAKPGDWIIRGVAGEFYPCKPEIFEATYEEADAGLLTRPLPTREEIADVILAESLFGSRTPIAAADAVLALLKGQDR